MISKKIKSMLLSQGFIINKKSLIIYMDENQMLNNLKINCLDSGDTFWNRIYKYKTLKQLEQIIKEFNNVRA